MGGFSPGGGISLPQLQATVGASKDSLEAQLISLAVQHNALVQKYDNFTAGLELKIAAAVAKALQDVGLGNGTPNPTPGVNPIVPSVEFVSFSEDEFPSSYVTLNGVAADTTRSVEPIDAYTTFNGPKTLFSPTTTKPPAGTYVYTFKDTLTADPTKFVTSTFTVIVRAAESSEEIPFDALNYEKPVVGSGGSLVWVPNRMALTASEDVAAFNFNTDRAIPQCYGAFGLIFEQGKVMPGNRLEYVREDNNAVVPMDYKALTLHSDGSVEHARIYCLRPALTTNQTIRVKVRKTATAAGATLDHTSLSSVPLSGAWAVKRSYGYAPDNYGATPLTPNPINLTWNQSITATAIAAAPSDPWEFQGSIAAEKRYFLDMPQALRICVDAIKFVDGTWQFSVIFAADVQFWDTSVDAFSWLSDINLSLNGTSLLAVNDFRFGMGQTFAKKLNTGKTAAMNALWNPPEHNIQVDTPLWSQMALLPMYDYGRGISPTALNSLVAGITDNATTYAPLAGFGVARAMGNPGGRMDIGYMPGQTAFWALTQDVRARDVVMAMGDASGAVPWNFYDPNKAISLNIFEGIGYPGFWQDGRSGSNPPNMRFHDGWHRWSVDYAHQPMLSAAPYLMTGDRFYRERLECQGNNAFNATYQRRGGVPGGLDQVLMNNGQTREAGWLLRDVSVALRCLPDVSPFKSRFKAALEYNFSVMLAKLEQFTAWEGETFGWLIGLGSANEMRAWENDHVYLGVSSAYFAGVDGALTYLKWAFNWAIDRFYQDQNVFPYKKATYYTFKVGGNLGSPDTNPPGGKTWLDMAAKASAGDSGLNSNGYQAGGNFIQLGLRTAALYATVFNSAKARDIITVHETENAPYVDSATYQREPQDCIRPLVWKSGKTAPQPDYSGIGTSPPAPGQAPTVPAGQVFPASTATPAETQVGTVTFGGGTPTSSAISTVNSPFELRNIYELWVVGSLTGQTVGDRTLGVTASNANGTVNGEITIQISAPAAANNIFDVPAADIFGLYGLERTLNTTYTGPVCKVQRKSDNNTLVVNMTSGAVAESIYTTFAAGGEIVVIELYDMSGQGMHLASTVDRGPRLTNGQGVLFKTVGGRMAMDFIYGKWLKRADVVLNRKGLGTAAVGAHEYTNMYSRVVNFVQNGDANDYSAETSALVLGYRNGPYLQRFSTASGEAPDVITGKSYAKDQAWFGAGGYPQVGGSYIQADEAIQDGTSNYSALFGTGTIRVGSADDNGRDEYAGKLSELVIFKNPTKANAALVRANVKPRFGLA